MAYFFGNEMYCSARKTGGYKSMRFVLAGIIGSAVKLCIALALLPLVTSCDAKAPVASESARHAEALFEQHCVKAGETIKRRVKDVEGVFLLKGRPKGINYSDQFQMDDPYGSDHGGDAYIMSLLKAKQELKRRYAALRNDTKPLPPDALVGFDYVEMADPNGMERTRFTAYVKQPGKTDTNYSMDYFQTVLQLSPAAGAMPRYAVTYDDISTHEDRMVWIAGSSLKVIDLQTNEVIAERIGYMIDRGQGSTSGGRSPWLLAASNACPAFPGRHAEQANQTARFVEKVLFPIRRPEK